MRVGVFEVADPAKRLDVKEAVARMRAIDPELVDALLQAEALTLGGRVNIRALKRMTGRTKYRVGEDLKKLKGVAR